MGHDHRCYTTQLTHSCSRAWFRLFRGYDRLRGSPQHRIPEWVEEITLYVVARAAEKLEEALELYQVDAETRDACKQAFGCPDKWADLPMAVVFEDRE